MKAVVYKEKGTVELCSRPRPEIIETTDAVVRVTLAAICSSDLHIKRGAVPRAREGVIVGHELVGVVEETGDAVRRFKRGDRVAVNVETFCGECFFCKRGYVNNCEQGGWLLGCTHDGGQAEYCRVMRADTALSLIPDNVTDEQALFVGDILATGYWAAEIANIQKEDTIAAIGAGPTGLCTLMCARLFSPKRIILTDTSEERLALAKRLGLADECVLARDGALEAAARACTEGRGADIVFELAGGDNTFELAWKAARKSGTVVVVALYERPQILPLNEMYGKNLTFMTGGVHANRCDRLLELIAEGRIDTTPLITHKAPIDRAIEGYHTFENHLDGCIKWAITF